MTSVDLSRELHPAPPPHVAGSALIADVTLFAALGLLLALAVGLVARIVTHRRPTRRENIQQRLALALNAQDDQQVLALAQLLKDLGPDGEKRLWVHREKLYQPDHTSAKTALLTEVRQLARL